MPMLLPECRDVLVRDDALWPCARSVGMGGCCLFTLAIALYGWKQILPIFLARRWYATNLVMLTLTVLQMALLAYECLVVKSAKILVAAKYYRALQVAISCLLYGKIACDLMNKGALYLRLLVPIVAIAMLTITVNATIVLDFEDTLDCHHLTWLLTSIVGVILSSSFAFPGRIILQHIKNTTALQRKHLGVVSSAVSELEQSHQQLWILVVCNVISSTFQLAVDVYVTYVLAGDTSCNSMFFEDGSGMFEQLFRLFISSISFVLPNWAAIYVFFLLPRFQFATTLDVPDLGESNYELLLSELDEDDIIVA